MATRKRVKAASGEPNTITKTELDDPGFEVRDGDTLTVNYAGAKVSIQGTYSSVELDGVYFKRTLIEGDDPHEQFERIYSFVKSRAESHAREKLMAFADMCNRANERAKGNG